MPPPETFASYFAVRRAHRIRRLVDFLVLLRPAWWVLRGYAVALIFMTVFVGNQGFLPDLSGAGLLGWLFALVLIGVSIRIGRIPLPLPLRARPLWLAAGAVLGAVMLFGVAAADDSGRSDSGSAPVYYDGDRAQVYIYDERGTPLSGVRVYDRDGNPVPVGVPFGCEPTWPDWRESRGCAPAPEPSSDPTATPTDGTAPAGGPAPSAGGGPSPGASGGTSVAPPFSSRSPVPPSSSLPSAGPSPGG